MKIIRLTDDHYIMEVGPAWTSEQAVELMKRWKEWMAEPDPKPLLLGSPVEYEDHRDSNIEKRVQNLEAFFGEALKRMIDEETSSS